jgi:hypothetical protein
MRLNQLLPLGLLLLLLIFTALPVNSQQGLIISPGGQGATGITSVSGTVGTSSTKITLTAPSQYITIVNGGTGNLYFSAVSPATTSSFPILPQAAYGYEGVPLTSFYLIAAVASTPYGVLAH